MLHQIKRLHVCKLFTESPRDVAQARSLVGSDVTEFSKGAEGTPHEVEVEERKLEEVDDVDRRQTAQVLQNKNKHVHELKPENRKKSCVYIVVRLKRGNNRTATTLNVQ